MKKIPTLFKRSETSRSLVVDEITPEAKWVADGEGVATRKWDGTCCMVRDGKLYKRYDCKKGKQPPPGFEPAQEPDPVTDHWPGWVPVGEGPDDRWHREAYAGVLVDGTYELCGPKVQGNPEGFVTHVLIPHFRSVFEAPRTFEGLREFFQEHDMEGIVWHHPDGRMAKIKARDFGIQRKPAEQAQVTASAK